MSNSFSSDASLSSSSFLVTESMVQGDDCSIASSVPPIVTPVRATMDPVPPAVHVETAKVSIKRRFDSMNYCIEEAIKASKHQYDAGPSGLYLEVARGSTKRRFDFATENAKKKEFYMQDRQPYYEQAELQKIVKPIPVYATKEGQAHLVALIEAGDVKPRPSRATPASLFHQRVVEWETTQPFQTEVIHDEQHENASLLNGSIHSIELSDDEDDVDSLYDPMEIFDDTAPDLPLLEVDGDFIHTMAGQMDFNHPLLFAGNQAAASLIRYNGNCNNKDVSLPILAIPKVWDAKDLLYSVRSNRGSHVHESSKFTDKFQYCQSGQRLYNRRSRGLPPLYAV